MQVDLKIGKLVDGGGKHPFGVGVEAGGAGLQVDNAIGEPVGGEAPGAGDVPPMPISCCAAGNGSLPAPTWLWQLLQVPVIEGFTPPMLVRPATALMVKVRV